MEAGGDDAGVQPLEVALEDVWVHLDENDAIFLRFLPVAAEGGLEEFGGASGDSGVEGEVFLCCTNADDERLGHVKSVKLLNKIPVTDLESLTSVAWLVVCP